MCEDQEGDKTKSLNGRPTESGVWRPTSFHQEGLCVCLCVCVHPKMYAEDKTFMSAFDLFPNWRETVHFKRDVLICFDYYKQLKKYTLRDIFTVCLFDKSVVPSSAEWALHCQETALHFKDITRSRGRT